VRISAHLAGGQVRSLDAIAGRLRQLFRHQQRLHRLRLLQLAFNALMLPPLPDKTIDQNGEHGRWHQNCKNVVDNLQNLKRQTPVGKK